MEFFTIDTERFILTKVTPEIFTYVFENYPEEEIARFFGAENEDEMEKERGRYEKGLRTFNKTFLFFTIKDKTINKVIGSLGFHTWYIDHDRAELFYFLKHDEYKKKGIISETLPIVLSYGYNEMNLRRVEAFVGPNNDASLNVMRKFGFTQEGVMREHYRHSNNLEDSVVFSLLRGEFLTSAEKT